MKFRFSHAAHGEKNALLPWLANPGANAVSAAWKRSKKAIAPEAVKAKV